MPPLQTDSLTKRIPVEVVEYLPLGSCTAPFRTRCTLWTSITPPWLDRRLWMSPLTCHAVTRTNGSLWIALPCATCSARVSTTIRFHR